MKKVIYMLWAAPKASVGLCSVTDFKTGIVKTFPEVNVSQSDSCSTRVILPKSNGSGRVVSSYFPRGIYASGHSNLHSYAKLTLPSLRERDYRFSQCQYGKHSFQLSIISPIIHITPMSQGIFIFKKRNGNSIYLPTPVPLLDLREFRGSERPPSSHDLMILTSDNFMES